MMLKVGSLSRLGDIASTPKMQRTIDHCRFESGRTQKNKQDEDGEP